MILTKIRFFCSILNSTIESLVMNTITANDLKIHGITALQKKLAKQPEVTISVRGKEKFVAMDIEYYHYLRECELEAAILESRSDIETNKIIIESADKHIKRIIKAIRKLCSS